MIFGHSVLGAPLEAESFGEGPTLALVHGGIHGDEPGAPEMVSLLAARLRGAPPTARVVLVTAVNPDGLRAGKKNNAHDVDLNRNFPAKSWRADHAPGYFPGPSPLSEPESRALAELIDTERPKRLVAVHQPFRCVNFDGPARPLAERMAAACGWPVTEDIGYPTPGSFGALYGVDRGLEVITLELPRPLAPLDRDAALTALLAACAP